MENIIFKQEKDFALRLDEKDDLALFRKEFVFEDTDLIYMDGNSLGRLPQRSVGYIQKAVEEGWGHDLIRCWNSDWFEAPRRIGEKIGNLIGAAPGQVIVSDSTSVNLFKLTMACSVANSLS